MIVVMSTILVMNLSGQVVDISDNSEGIVIPRMSESQRKSISSDIEGMLLYQTDGASGFYYNNGSSWIKLSDTKDNIPQVQINGESPSLLGLFYVGPTYDASGAEAQQFVNDKGYYLNILNNDSIAHTVIYYKGANCSGKKYSNSNITARGKVSYGNAELLYVPKDAQIIGLINVLSHKSFPVQGGAMCYNLNLVTHSVFELLINDPKITGIDLNPQDGYRVSFGQ